MVAEGTITAEEGAKLLAALESQGEKRKSHSATGEPGEPGEPSEPRWFRVRVTDLETGRSKVNVNLPMSLVDAGARLGARFAPELETSVFAGIMDEIRAGAQGKIVDVEDAQGGERVEIYVE
jgi:hypothetical protein